jgi:filamentous hemagglutinin
MAGGPGSGSLFSAEVGVGVKTDDSSSKSQSHISQGATITGGNNVTLTSTEGDLHIVQGGLSAGDTLRLDSARDLILEAGRTSSAAKSDGHNAGVEVGVGVSVGAQTGLYAYVAVDVGNSHGKSDSVTWKNTHLSAGEAIDLSAQGDTTLRGAVATAEAINLDTGGALTIESLQDTMKVESDSSGVSLRVQVSFGTAWSVEGSYNAAQTSGHSESVTEQSGLFAGEGGYHVRAGTVSLIGGAIASANAANSSLSADALRFSDLQNVMDFGISSFGVKLGYGNTEEGKENKLGVSDQLNKFKTGEWLEPKSGFSLGGDLPLEKEGGDRSTTYATLTEGNIMIGGQPATAESTGIHTDASDANAAIDKLPDLKAMLAEQKALTAAVGKATSGVRQMAKDIASNAKKEREEIEKAYKAGLDEDGLEDFNRKTAKQQKETLSEYNPAYKTAYEAEENWGGEGDYNLALQFVTAAVMGTVAGQGEGQAIGNALAPIATLLIAKEFDPDTGRNPNMTLDVLSRTLLGALLAEVNGHHPAVGALSTAGGELAMRYLAEKIYGKSDLTTLNPDEKKTLTALSQAIAMLAGGLSGDAGIEALAGANIAKNAMANIARKATDQKNAQQQGNTQQQEKAQPQASEGP